MTIQKAITTLDQLKHNTYTQSDKTAWLSRVDAMIKRLVIDTHEGAEAVAFTGYDDTTDMEAELLAPEPYDEMYLRYMEAQIDYLNHEYGKYNNAITMFNKVFEEYKNYYNRTHMPLGGGFRYF